MSDKYELKCQSTDEDYLEDESNNVLLPEKKYIANSKMKYRFKEFSDSYIFQIIMALFIVFILYYGMKYILLRVSVSHIDMKGGGNIKYLLKK